MMFKPLVVVSLFITLSCITSTPKSVQIDKKLEVVNPDYGILSELYRTRSGKRPLMWRCFRMKDVAVKYRTWRDADPLGPYNQIVSMCDFEIVVKGEPISHVYHGRRGKPVTYCSEFKAAWKKLTLGEEHICMEGETLTKGEPEIEGKSKKEVVNWTWDKIATKRGCYSFWDSFSCVDF